MTGTREAEQERLTALGGLAALSLDALSSVAYGPEAILIVLVAAGTAGLKYSLPVTGAICATGWRRSPRRLLHLRRAHRYRK